MSAVPDSAMQEVFQQVDNLCDELQIAVQQVGANSLAGLEESVWRQQMLCEAVRHAIGALPPATEVQVPQQASRGVLRRLRDDSRTLALVTEQALAANRLLLLACGPVHLVDGRQPVSFTGTLCSVEA